MNTFEVGSHYKVERKVLHAIPHRKCTIYMRCDKVFNNKGIISYTGEEIWTIEKGSVNHYPRTYLTWNDKKDCVVIPISKEEFETRKMVAMV